ncbi:MAG TPA: uroporphyrinogen decarboxylase family protein [bacterium]|nr:uroporphyrinogen decarboxylase family protein [bacterium]HPN45508.1 uroporphyrinogen decarboxylase family protein [bacterium]
MITKADQSRINMQMQDMLLHAFTHPAEKNCFYSLNGISSSSNKLNKLAIWDWSPQSAVQVPGNSTCIFPLAVGCRTIIMEDGKEWAEPLFTEEDLLNRSSLPLPNNDVWEGKSGELLCAMQKLMTGLKDNEQIRAVDIQSPLGIAEVICGSGLYTALLLNPEPIQALLQDITSFIIRFINEMRKICGNRLNGTQFPYIWNNNEGTLCSDDTLSLLSPAMHEQFSLPWVIKIAQACGPLFYHSCTWREEYFENIKKIPNIRAYNWNPGNSVDAKIIIREFSGRAVLAPHLCAGMHLTEDTRKWGDFSDEADMLHYMLDCMQHNTSMYFWIGDMQSKPEVLEKMFDLFDERGFTPQAKVLG